MRDDSPLWILPPPSDEADIARLCSVRGLLRPTAEILRRRVGAEAGDEEVARFLHPALADLHDPYLFTGMREAVTRLADAVMAREPVTIYGDYDVDGTSSTAFVAEALAELGVPVTWRIPNRMTDGYGLSDRGVDLIRECPGRLVVLLDCGVTAVEEVEALAREGREVIIVDHHEPGPRLPQAVAVLDAKRADGGYPFDGLAAVGVALKLVHALGDVLGVPQGHLLARGMDLVALGTAADIVPIRDENRVLMRYGLRRLEQSPRPGLRALIDVAGLDGKELTTSHIVFGLAPRINAPGRLKSADAAVRLLMTRDEREARMLAGELNRENRERQQLDRRILDAARCEADAQIAAGARALVLADAAWHPGIIGIVAARLVELYALPTVLVALQDPVGRGSGRSVPGFDLYAALGECADTLESFGGHVRAAGLSIRSEQIDTFRARFQEVAAARLTDDMLRRRLVVDAVVPLGEVTRELVRQLDWLGPFGPENMRPVLASLGVHAVAPPVILREEHLRVRVQDGRTVRNAIAFGQAASAPLFAGPVDIAYVAEEEAWRGERRLQLRIKAVRPAG